MLKLRKVELIGFKSFCEKTQITFSGTGVTCIVGPNGCGKSNIVDAISWVLGEQSHKSLRAERMADCIFNGTAKRPPLGMAEVLLHLEDPELAEAAKFVLEGEGKEAKEGEEAKELESAADAAVKSSNTEDTENPTPNETAPREGAEAASTDGGGTDESDALAEGKRGRKKRAAEKPVPHLKPGEVVVGRRLYRSGQSEYLINGRVARLRDIQEMFMGMGLGPDSYAIIEQGRIGQILSSKPLDRRAIIEEAAGITKFKTKKRLAEAKLESSQINLARVNDILVEVEKQLGSLKRQASKARRYAEIREQMRGLLRQVLASKAKELDAEAERLALMLREYGASEAQQVAAVQQLEVEQDRLGTRTYELDAELRQNQNLLGQTALELDRSQNQVGFNRQRLQELGVRNTQLAAELDQIGAQGAQLDERAAAQQQTVAALREETQHLESLLEQLSERAADLTGSAQATEEHINELRRAAGALGEELTRLHGEQVQAEQAVSLYAEAHGRLKQSEQQLLEESVEQLQRAETAALALQADLNRAEGLEKTVRDAQARIAELRREAQDTKVRAESARDALAEARARKASLDQILAERSYTADAVQKLFAANGEATERNFRAVGVLADYAEVQEQYETAIEQFLREELEYVVVETFDHARAGIALLREEVGGRATFFVDSMGNLKSNEYEPIVLLHASEGIVSRLDRLVEFRNPLGPAAKQFLPRLRSAFLVETATVAERLASENPQYHFVTTDGTCYQGRMVSGGRPTETGPLGMKRELRQLEAEALRLEHAATEAQAELQRLHEELRGTEQSLEGAVAEHVEAQKAVVSATHLHEHAQAELARFGSELASCRAELTRVQNELQAAQRRAEAARKRHTLASESRSTAEEETAQAAARLASLRQLIGAHQEEMAGRRTELATLAERRASAESLAARLTEERRQTTERAASLHEQQAALGQEQGELESQTSQHQRQMEFLNAEKTRLEQRKAALEQEWEQSRTRTVGVDDALRLARQRLGDLREERGRTEVQRARNDTERDHLRESSLAELNIHPEDLIAEATALLTGDELLAAETNYREMRARIEAMGPVNMMALEEYNECEQRFTFLNRERDDLLQSIADTHQAIRELDEVSRQRFEEAFTVINGNFVEAFRTLFGGGTGEMRLTEPDSSGESGIDIVAQPPGKRLQNVLLLSGGEKALTALALLIAIFRYQPSPFCILDEVDAPLDEANVGRFTQMVGAMSAQTQFIIVTHNRRTMEMAPALYGVTMQEPGVSKLVSVRWEEAPNAAGATTAAATAA